MKTRSRWLWVVLASCLLGGSFLGPTERLEAAPASQTAGKQAVVSINKADQGELEGIRGIGPALAERIVRYRETNGRFENLEDLIRVPGIGPAKFERIKDEIAL